MSASGPNPVLAPVRRWVLYSRAHLAITIAGFVALLFVAGAIFGQTPPRPPASTTATEVTAAENVAHAPAITAESITYELDEVTESQVATQPTTWTATSAPATAMAYAHAFADPTVSDTTWLTALAQFTKEAPDETLVSARPRIPLVITGPTSSRLEERAGTRTAHVVVPTQVGNMQIVLTVADHGTRWAITTPPTLSLSEAERSTATSPPSATPTFTTPNVTTPATSELGLPISSRAAPPASAGTAAGNPFPEPVPGPLPIPELDTPIPGER
ncbi:hypothetical protein I0Q12_06720 [Rhodococcus sp. CX]|uniref:hypothetical protein n=1 Tax=Rhodococcus sp. CX TaxID=2789880 RepID=UPI0018CDB6E8|nr:hypothetical protein [Rhodococcus sp. CX]MBH0119235.1 hypothetical protein [Rhodococcus sp. CX]